MLTVNANGARMPALGFGTWRLRGEECASLVKHAVASGYTSIDTAIMYDNEEDVGEGLRRAEQPRDQLFITSKVWPSEVMDGQFQRCVEGSLKRLGLDYLDLVLIHWPPQDNDDVAEWMRLLNDVADQGLARNIGVSNFTIPLIERAVAASHRPLACNQVEHHPYINQSRLRQVCDDHGIALVGYCPLFRGGDLFEQTAITSAAAAHGKSPAQIVLRWHVQSGCVAIPKTATPSRAVENIDIFDFELTGDQMDAINALTARHERICDYDFSPQWDVP